jgi:hypothetical protein
MANPQTIKYGTVLESRDTRNNFKARPDGGGATMILKGSSRCPFKKGDRVLCDDISLGEHVDFAGGYSLFDLSWPTKEFMRTMGLPHWGRVLREGLAAAFASLPPQPSPPLTSVVLYDPLLLGCKLPHGGKASYYLLAIVGKLPIDVRVGAGFAGSWARSGEEPTGPFMLEDPTCGPFLCTDYAHGGAYKTKADPALFMDPLLCQADHGQVWSLPVPGLVRTGFDNMPYLEREVIQLCGELSRF